MDRRFVVVVCSLVILLVARAESEGSTVGTTGAAFLKLNVGARAEALGEAGAVGLEGVESLYWNPAGLAGAGDQGRVLVSHQQLWQGVDATAAAVGFPQWRIGSVALGFQRLGVESWSNLSDESGIDAGDLAVLLGYARRLTARMDVGMTARTLHSRIGDDSANGFSVDYGVRYQLSDRLLLAGAVRNIGPGISFRDGDEDPLPLTGSFGGALEWKRHPASGRVGL
jgi:hypothetical protein